MKKVNVENVVKGFEGKTIRSIKSHNFNCLFEFTDGTKFDIVIRRVDYPILNDHQDLLKYVIDNKELPEEV